MLNQTSPTKKIIGRTVFSSTGKLTLVVVGLTGMLASIGCTKAFQPAAFSSIFGGRSGQLDDFKGPSVELELVGRKNRAGSAVGTGATSQADLLKTQQDKLEAGKKKQQEKQAFDAAISNLLEKTEDPELRARLRKAVDQKNTATQVVQSKFESSNRKSLTRESLETAFEGDSDPLGLLSGRSKKNPPSRSSNDPLGLKRKLAKSEKVQSETLSLKKETQEPRRESEDPSQTRLASYSAEDYLPGQRLDRVENGATKNANPLRGKPVVPDPRQAYAPTPESVRQPKSSHFARQVQYNARNDENVEQKMISPAPVSASAQVVAQQQQIAELTKAIEQMQKDLQRNNQERSQAVLATFLKMMQQNGGQNLGLGNSPNNQVGGVSQLGAMNGLSQFSAFNNSVRNATSNPLSGSGVFSSELAQATAKHASGQPGQNPFASGNSFVSENQTNANHLRDSRSAQPVTNAASRSQGNQFQPGAPGNWKSDLQQTIASLKSRLGENLSESEKVQLETNLRFLYLIANDQDAALKSIDSLPPEMKAYWNSQIFSLAQIMESSVSDGSPTFVSQSIKANRALPQLTKAMESLANVAHLKVKNPNFCKEVISFGNYKVADSLTFNPGEMAVVYFELENYLVKTNSGIKGQSFETILRPSFKILDSSGRIVDQFQYDQIVDVCQSKRKDFYVNLEVVMPRLPSGRYRLVVSVQDVLGKKAGSSMPLDFSIR